MGVHHQTTIFLLTYFLLSSCLCTQPTRSRRQKRGLMKMMMHIMWDPVRLIRYYYAYDVTREIAKSWRKILPTIMLLPFTQNSPHSYSGIAKYVHPTVGVAGSSKKKSNLKYFNVPSSSHYQGSAGNVKPVAIPPDLLHHILPSRYSYSSQQAPQQYYFSSQEIENDPRYEHKSVPHVIVGHDPYIDEKESGNQYSITHYFVGDDNSQEQVPISSKETFYPEPHHHDLQDYIRFSSSQNVPSKHLKNRPRHKVSPITYQSHYEPHTGPHGSIVQHDSNQEPSHIIHPGQEFHIVLHPIPVSKFHPDYLTPSPDNKHAVHFVPVRPRSNKTRELNDGPPPILFRAVLSTSTESTASHEEYTINATSQDGGSAELHLDSREVNNTAEMNSSADGKSRITWTANPSRRKDPQATDLRSDDTVARVSSVHKNNPRKYKFKKGGSSEKVSAMQSFGLNRHSINMERLREALKHGTPVLIPFDKNAHYSEIAPDLNMSSQVQFPKTNNQSLNAWISSPPIVPTENYVNIETSSEHSGERNSTQRLLLFLKRKNTPLNIGHEEK